MPITQTYKYAADLEQGACVATLRQPLATLDANAHTFAVTVTQGGAPADLSGTACEGWFIRADGVTIPIDGEISGNTAAVTLLPACYEVAGRFLLAVKLTQGEQIHTILRADGSVTVSRTDLLAPGGEATQSFDMLLAELKAAYTKGYAENILINGDWSDPINQRNETSYKAAGYAIDRWRINGTLNLTVNDGYVALDNGSSGTQYMEQRIVPGRLVEGMSYTAVLKTVDGTVYCGSCAVSATPTTVINPAEFYVKIGTGSEYGVLQVHVRSGYTVKILWVALYEGVYTAENHPAFASKGYAAELAECMRYYVRFLSNAQLTIGGYGYSATAGRFTIPLGMPMRAVPGLSLASIGSGHIYPGSITPTGIGGVAMSGPMVTFGLTAASGITANAPAMFHPATVMELDAEL